MMPVTIQTERLLLRPWKFLDAPAVLAMAQDENWGSLNNIPYPFSECDAESFIAHNILAGRSKRASWVIEWNGQHAGSIRIAFFHDGKTGELGYSIRTDFWGNGLATEAGRAMIDKAFEVFPSMLRIRAFAHHENLASRRVMEKMGMTYEATLRANYLNRGELVDEVCYGILRNQGEAKT